MPCHFIMLPNLAFAPKVSDSACKCSALELRAFYPITFSFLEKWKLHNLRLVKPISFQRLSHWMVESIELACTSINLNSGGLKGSF